MAVLGTQAVATLIAVYGLFMTPLGWGWAGMVWAYAVAWFLMNDRIKLLAYRIFDPAPAGSKPEARAVAEPEIHDKAEVKPDAEAEAKPAIQAEAKPEVKAESTPGARAQPQPVPNAETRVAATLHAATEPDVTPHLVKRVHDLYEALGREDVRMVEDWEKSRKDDPGPSKDDGAGTS